MAYLMKGKHWSDRNSFRRKLQYPVLVEPKIDEIRVHIIVRNRKVEFLSYAGKPLHNMQGFAEEWAYFTLHGLGCLDGVFDVGFEVNGNFDDSSRWIKSSRGIPKDLADAGIRFYLFDLPEHAGTLVERKMAIAQALNKSQALRITQLGFIKCYCETEVVAAYLRFRRLGHEGAMVKEPNGLYEQGKRSQLWLKMKPEETADGKITGFVEAVASVADPLRGISIGDGLGRVGSVHIRTEEGHEASPHGIPHALGRDMYVQPEKYLGDWVEFAFMERASAGGFRHPVFRRLRDAKD